MVRRLRLQVAQEVRELVALAVEQEERHLQLLTELALLAVQVQSEAAAAVLAIKAVQAQHTQAKAVTAVLTLRLMERMAAAVGVVDQGR